MSEFKIEVLKKTGFSEDEINLYGIDFFATIFNISFQ